MNSNKKQRIAMSIACALSTVAAIALLSRPVLAQEASAAPAGALVLGTLKVTDQEDRLSPHVASSGTKSDTPLVETPQAITIVPMARAQEQGAQNIQDALRYATGVTAEPYGLDSRGDWGFIRGTDFTQYLDGMRMITGYYNNSRPDINMLERAEVLRGPSSVLYGQGSTGGLINLVSKRPNFDGFGGKVGVEYGTNDRKQVSADVNVPVSDQIAARLVVVARDSGTMVAHVPDDRLVVAPSITFKPTEDTDITLLGMWQKDNGGPTTQFLPHSGTLLPNPNGQYAFSTFLGEPGFERYDTRQSNIGWLISHRVNDAITLRQNFRYTTSSVDYQAHYPDVYSNPANPFLDSAQRILDRFSYVSKPKVHTLTVDNQAEAKFDTWSVSHKIVGGIDYQWFRQRGQEGFALSTPIDSFAPVYGTYVYPTLFPMTEQRQRQIGFYVQDQISINEYVDVVLGARRDKATANTGGVKQTDTAFTKRAAILLKNLGGFYPYISYNESFIPVAGTNFYGDAYSPQKGKQYEFGTRWQPTPESPLMLSFAAYDMRERNRLTNDPGNPFNQVQSGEVHTKGIELGADMRVEEDYDLVLSYALTDAETSKSNTPGAVGLKFESVAKHTASAWGSKYVRLNEDWLLQFGGGARYVGRSPDAANVLYTPSRTLVDALAAVEYRDVRFAINATNLTDKKFYATCLTRGDCFLGSRRTVVGSISWKF